MQRSYLIVLIVCGGIFLFAVGFYAFSDSKPGGRTATPPEGVTPADDAGDTAEGAADPERGEYATPPGRSLATGPDNRRSTSRADTTADPPIDRRDADARDGAAEDSGSTLSTLDRLKSTVDRANRADSAADTAEGRPAAAPTGRGEGVTATSRGEVGPGGIADAPRREAGGTDADTEGPPTFTLGGPDDANRDASGESERDTDSPLRDDGDAAANRSAGNRPSRDVAGAANDRGTTASRDSQPDRRPSPEPRESEPRAARDTRSAERSADRTYTVQPGDTLEGIAIQLYGDAVYWDEIAQANPLVDPRRLRVGQELRLPSPAVIEGDAEDEQQIVAPGEVVRYTVRPGDTLSTIARTYYGQATRWRYLYNVNRETIGANPNALQAGDVLEIPPFPEVAE